MNTGTSTARFGHPKIVGILLVACGLALSLVAAPAAWADTQVCQHVAWEKSYITKPTCTEAGVMLRTCVACGQSEQVSVEPTGHSRDRYGYCTKCDAKPMSLKEGTGKSLSEWEKVVRQELVKGWSSTKKVMNFPGQGVPIDALTEVRLEHRQARSDTSKDGVMSQKSSDMMVALDRWAVLDFGNEYDCVIDQETGIKYADNMVTTYKFTKKQIAKAEKVSKKVAAAAKKKGGATARMRYIHDWIIDNSVCLGYKSYDWKNYTAYGFTRDQIYGSTVTSGGSTAQLLSHHGVCWNYTLTFARICKAAGVSKVRIVMAPNHAFNAYKTSSGWRYTDVTWDDPISASRPGWEHGVVNHRYFMVTKKGLGSAEAHQF